MNLQRKIQQYVGLIERRQLNNEFTFEAQQPIYNLEAEILSAHGLPPSFAVSEALQLAVINETGTISSAEDIEDFLQKMATEYLLSKPLTDKEILESGRENKTSYDNVLQYMGIIPHWYCVFVFEELYCRNKINTEETLVALYQYARDVGNEINALVQNINDYEIKIDFPMYIKLCNAGYPYLDRFIQFEIDIKCRSEADSKSWDILFKKKGKLGGKHTIAHFYITNIECSKSDNLIFLDCIFKDISNSWFAIVIPCDKSLLDIFLSNSRYMSPASLIKANIDNGVQSIHLRDHVGMNQLEIRGLTLELESANSEKDMHEGHFIIDDFYNTDPNDPLENINIINCLNDLPF